MVPAASMVYVSVVLQLQPQLRIAAETERFSGSAAVPCPVARAPGIAVPS